MKRGNGTAGLHRDGRGPETEIRLQLAGGDPPSGRLVDERGGSTDFTGWLELMAALEWLLGGRREQPDEQF